MKRRTFIGSALAALASVPIIGWAKSPSFKDGTMKMVDVRENLMLDKAAEYVDTVNSKHWMGHAPGTIKLSNVTWDRQVEGYRVVSHFEKNVGPLASTYKSLDFNKFDFGKQV